MTSTTTDPVSTISRSALAAGADRGDPRLAKACATVAHPLAAARLVLAARGDLRAIDVWVDADRLVAHPVGESFESPLPISVADGSLAAVALGELAFDRRTVKVASSAGEPSAALVAESVQSLTGDIVAGNDVGAGARASMVGLRPTLGAFPAVVRVDGDSVWWTTAALEGPITLESRSMAQMWAAFGQLLRPILSA